MDNSLFNDPLAMAGLSVMSGKNLGDALSEAAQLKQRSDYQAMQMQLWQAQAQQAMQQAKLNQQLMSDPSFGGVQQMTQTVMPNMPQQGGYDPNQQGQVPPVGAVQESDIPPMPNYLNSQEAQNLQRRMALGAAAGNQGVVDAAKLQLDNLKELAKQSYESTNAPRLEANKQEASAKGKARGEAMALQQSLEASLPQLGDVVTKLSELGKKATYSYAGQGLDFAMEQTGMQPREGAVARSDYISTVDNEILPLLRQTFGAQFTENEGKSLKATLGDPDASPAKKDARLRSFITAKIGKIQSGRKELGLPEFEVPESIAKLQTIGLPSKGNEIMKNAGKPPSGAPEVGFVSKGHRFLGGNPADKNSWEAVR